VSATANGVVAVSHPLAAEAGAAILRSGGNAVDAAVAIQFALAVVEPLASGLGGGAVWLVHLAAGSTEILDARESAPAAARADQLLDPSGQPLSWEAQCHSGAAVATPGTLAGLVAALARWGSLPLARLIAPAIELAAGDLALDAFFARRLAQNSAKLAADPVSAATFLPGGQALGLGDRLRQPDLGRALRLIAVEGPAALYGGEIGRALVDAVQRRGGCLTLDDLATYRVVWRRPLIGRYRQYELQTMPPPGAGLTLLQMLALVEPLGPKWLGRLSVPRAHAELQAMRLALLDRAAYLADPDHAQVPVTGLLDRHYLNQRRAEVVAGPLGPAPATGVLDAFHPGAAPAAEHGETTHFTVTDRWGNLVGCTSTIEDFFGCGITVPGFGLLLNNEMTDFSPRPGDANAIRPFARPASSMAPTLLVRDGRPELALGSPGGPTIVTAIFQTLLRLVDDGLALQEAIEAPRFFASYHPRLTWERGLPAETLAGVRELGHQPSSRPTTIGSIQAIARDPATGRWVGAADQRRLGTVIEVG
jgi:gamma-glutamyltranspeptidase/glutathione hydrolase